MVVVVMMMLVIAMARGTHMSFERVCTPLALKVDRKGRSVPALTTQHGPRLPS
jgi:hypothetical protein